MDKFVWVMEYFIGRWEAEPTWIAPNGSNVGVFPSFETLQDTFARWIKEHGWILVHGWAELNLNQDQFWYCRFNESDGSEQRIITVFAEKHILGELLSPGARSERRCRHIE